MKSVLTRLARLFEAEDTGCDPELSEATWESYPWGTPGAVTYDKVRWAITAIADEPSPGHEDEDEPPRQIPMARLALAAMRGVAREAYHHGLVGENVRIGLRDMKAGRLSGKTRGRRLSAAEIDRLYGLCASDDSPLGRRDAAILAVMIGCGLRRFETSNLDIDDYRPGDGDSPGLVVVRAGKGAKAGRVPSPSDLRLAIEDWLTVRGRNPGPMFFASRGGGHVLEAGSRLSPSGIYLVCTMRGGAVGVDFRPHDLRRTAITQHLERHGDLSLAAQFARHSTTETTKKYDERGEDALRKSMIGSSTGYRRQK